MLVGDNHQHRRLAIVAAVARNRVIGHNNTLPWHLPEDLRHFKALTLNHPIIMGRKTFLSLGHALPQRQNIVLTHSKNWQPEDALVAHSLSQALTLAHPSEEIFIIGGASVYAAALAEVDRLYLTEIEAEIDGDCYFPPYDSQAFIEIQRRPSRDKQLSFSFVTYERAKIPHTD